MGDTCWVTQATLDTFVPGSTCIQHHLNQFQVDCGHMQTKLCARQALWVAVGYTMVAGNGLVASNGKAVTFCDSSGFAFVRRCGYHLDINHQTIN